MKKLFEYQSKNNQEIIKHSLEDVWNLISEFQGCLKDLGLNVRESNFNKEYFFKETAEAGIPVISDGLDGARISFKKSSFERHGIERDGFYNLKLWFTNGLQNPDNEIRQKIQSKWDELMKKHFLTSTD
ncbi:MAG: hypothetical protein WC564_00560 [Patescibacteria group bacterium]|jgi:hypothetical protein